MKIHTNAKKYKKNRVTDDHILYYIIAITRVFKNENYTIKVTNGQLKVIGSKTYFRYFNIERLTRSLSIIS